MGTKPAIVGTTDVVLDELVSVKVVVEVSVAVEVKVIVCTAVVVVIKVPVVAMPVVVTTVVVGTVLVTVLALCVTVTYGVDADRINTISAAKVFAVVVVGTGVLAEFGA